jgi:hypothetical protein
MQFWRVCVPVLYAHLRATVIDLPRCVSLKHRPSGLRWQRQRAAGPSPCGTCPQCSSLAGPGRPGGGRQHAVVLRLAIEHFGAVSAPLSLGCARNTARAHRVRPSKLGIGGGGSHRMPIQKIRKWQQNGRGATFWRSGCWGSTTTKRRLGCAAGATAQRLAGRRRGSSCGSLPPPCKPPASVT